MSRLGLKPQPPVLPASLELATGTKADLSARKGFVGEPEVGILSYLGDPAYPGIQGVIKQRWDLVWGSADTRFTDFLVNEISLSGDIVHLVDIGAPADRATQPPGAGPSSEPQLEFAKNAEPSAENTSTETGPELPAELTFEAHPEWPASTTTALRTRFSDETIVALHALFLEGKDARKPVDAGWGSPRLKMTDEEEAMNISQGRDRGRGRSGRQGHSNQSCGPSETREVVSQVGEPTFYVNRKVISEKESRGAAHKAIRELFKGRFETSVRDDLNGGQRIVIRWARQGGGGGQRQQGKREWWFDKRC